MAFAGARNRKGEDGKDGRDGVDGLTPSISIGTVEDGDEARVRRRGTDAKVIFDFVLPRGKKGDRGMKGDDGMDGGGYYGGGESKTASQISVKPSCAIGSTNVQSALEELYREGIINALIFG